MLRQLRFDVFYIKCFVCCLKREEYGGDFMSKTCSKCGNVCDDSTVFCDSCGHRFENGTQGNARSNYNQNSSYQQNGYSANNQPYGQYGGYNQPFNSGYFGLQGEQPISTGKCFLYQLLFSLPFVGLIMVIIAACGGMGEKNTTLKNWARAYLIWQVIAIVLVIIIVIAGVGAGLSEVYGSNVTNIPSSGHITA